MHEYTDGQSGDPVSEPHPDPGTKACPAQPRMQEGGRGASLLSLTSRENPGLKMSAACNGKTLDGYRRGLDPLGRSQGSWSPPALILAQPKLKRTIPRPQPKALIGQSHTQAATEPLPPGRGQRRWEKRLWNKALFLGSTSFLYHSTRRVSRDTTNNPTRTTGVNQDYPKQIQLGGHPRPGESWISTQYPFGPCSS